MQAVDLAYAATLEPKLCVDYFRSKGYEVTWNWQDASQELHARAFTVAKAVRLDVLETIRTEQDRALAEGLTEREFKKTLKPRLQKAGWWGKQIIADSDGNAKEITLGTVPRLGNIYRTNLATCYQTGRYTQQLASVDTHPYWQYIAIQDGNTRGSHAAMHGRVFRWDDPIWETLYPPNDWGCRCRVRALTAAQVKALGLKVESSTGRLSTKVVDNGLDEFTGEIYQADVTTYSDGKTRMTTGAGWSGNVGRTAIGADVSMARKLIELKNRDLRQQVITGLNNAPERQNQFARWTGNVLTRKQPGQSLQALGFINDDIADTIESKTGNPVARLLTADAGTIKRANAATLSLAELQTLPQIVNAPQAVLWDNVKKQALYVGPSGSDGFKIVITPQPGNALDASINASSVTLDALNAAVKHGDYELLRGRL